MKNLFKSSDVLVQQIHDEFDQAQDRLLAEAKKIISSCNVNEKITNEEKAERLIKLGFINAEIVSEVNGKKEKLSKKVNVVVRNKAQAEIIEYYKQTYPFQKFITESELDRICSKYGLMYAPVSNYIKDVPEKNIAEIENTKPLAQKDMPLNKIYCKIDYDGILNIGNRRARKLGLPFIIQGEHFTYLGDINTYLKSIYPSLDGISYIAESGENVTEDRQGLFVAAPESHFDKSELTKQGKNGFLKITIAPIPKDPIVFRYVKGGIQIISKWGLEASDPIVVNEKLN